MGKRFVLLSLGVMMVSSTVLSACGPTDKPTDKPAASAGKTAPRKINILLSHEQAAYAQQLKDDDIYVKELSRLSGYDLKYEFLGHDEDYKKQLSLRFASMDLPDLIRTDSVNSTTHNGAVEQGVFLELGPLIDKYAPELKKKIPAELWQSASLSYNGKIYGIPATKSRPNTKVLAFREDWLDVLGMKAPTTTDEYLTFFEAVKQSDMNSNGKGKSYGTSAFDNLGWALFFFQSFDAYPSSWQVRDGKMTPNIIAPQMKNAISYYRTLYEKGYINPDFFTQKEADNVADIYKGKTGVWTGAMTKYESQYSKTGVTARYVGQPNAKISLVAPPAGPNGQKGGLTPEGQAIKFVWTIPATVKNPEDIVKFLEWCWSAQEADDFFSFGIKDYNYTVDSGKIKYNPKSDANKPSSFFQDSMNPKGAFALTDRIVSTMEEEAGSGDKDRIIAGYKASDAGSFKVASAYMPRLKSLSAKPELDPGLNKGTLFLDMFAKVVMGKEPLDPTFDNFVAEWKRRGGDELMREAQAWHDEKQKK
jgi:putative aldouronate transport system substrate-binding protein